MKWVMMTLEAAGNSWPRSRRFVHNYIILNRNQLIDQSINQLTLNSLYD